MTADGGDRFLSAPRFDVVLRGYDRQQVDEHLARLQRVIARLRADLELARSEQPSPPPPTTPGRGFRPAPGTPGRGFRAPTGQAPWSGPLRPPTPGPDVVGGFTDRMQSILRAAEEEAAEIRRKAHASVQDDEQLRARVTDLVGQRDAMFAELQRMRGQLESLTGGASDREPGVAAAGAFDAPSPVSGVPSPTAAGAPHAAGPVPVPGASAAASSGEPAAASFDESGRLDAAIPPPGARTPPAGEPGPAMPPPPVGSDPPAAAPWRAPGDATGPYPVLGAATGPAPGSYPVPGARTGPGPNPAGGPPAPQPRMVPSPRPRPTPGPRPTGVQSVAGGQAAPPPGAAPARQPSPGGPAAPASPGTPPVAQPLPGTLPAGRPLPGSPPPHLGRPPLPGPAPVSRPPGQSPADAPARGFRPFADQPDGDGPGALFRPQPAPAEPAAPDGGPPDRAGARADTGSADAGGSGPDGGVDRTVAGQSARPSPAPRPAPPDDEPPADGADAEAAQVDAVAPTGADPVDSPDEERRADADEPRAGTNGASHHANAPSSTTSAYRSG